MHRCGCFILLLAIGNVLFCLPCLSQPSDIFQLNDKSGLFADNPDLTILGLGAILTLAAWTNENHQMNQESLDEAPMIDVPMDVGNVYGSAWAVGSMTLGMGTVGYLTNQPRLTGAAWDLGKSLLITTAVVSAFKVAVDRTRPNYGQYSFPSGHTAAAFATAPIMHRHFGLTAGIATYAMATFTAMGRIEENKHYLSDVIAGATIGLLVSRYVSRDHERLSVFANPRQVGFSYDF